MTTEKMKTKTTIKLPTHCPKCALKRGVAVLNKCPHRKRGYFNPKNEWVEQVGARMDIGAREYGVIERYCRHGIGHPIGHVIKWEDRMGIHGCDGCCTKWEDENSD